MRIDQLTFTRFVAAVWIVILHFGTKTYPFNNDHIAILFRSGSVGVSYFFILSGFVMMIAYKNKSHVNPLDYFKKRFARIYPIYFLALLLMLFTQCLSDTIDIFGMGLSLFMVQAWIPQKALSFNAPGWSLSVEFLFYAIFPFVFNKYIKGKLKQKFFFNVIIIWVISQVVFNILFAFYGKDETDTFTVFLKYHPLMRVNEFLVGIAAGLLYVEHLYKKRANYDIQIIILLLFLIVLLKFPFGIQYNNGILAIVFVPLILLVSLNDGLITKLFKKRPLIFLGEISYSMYILQLPICALIDYYAAELFPLYNFKLIFFFKLFILILISALAYVFIEKPFQKMIKSKSNPV